MKDEWVNKIHQGDVIEVLKRMPDEFVDTVITSPPYWGLRSYGDETSTVWGGQPSCKHEWGQTLSKGGRTKRIDDGDPKYGKEEVTEGFALADGGNFCQLCGAWKGQLGLEPHPQMFIDHLVEIFREVKRVLKKSGSFYLVLGDTYFGGHSGGVHSEKSTFRKCKNVKMLTAQDYQRKHQSDGSNWLTVKQLMLIPSRVAIALQDDGLVLRNDIIWKKGNPMPSSVKDRLNNTFEHVFHFVKARKYYYDLDAIRVPYKPLDRWGGNLMKVPNKTKVKQGEKVYAVQYRERLMQPNLAGKNPGDVFGIPWKHIPMFLSREETAYIAGLIDSDGCISLQSKKRNDLMVVTIVNTHKGVMEWLKNRLGRGRIYERKRDEKWRKIYEFNLYGSNAGALIYDIYPWLIIKREQAKTALEFQSLGVKVGQTIEGWAKKKRKELVREMHDLNQYRIFKSSSPDPMKQKYKIKNDVWNICTRPFSDAHFAVFPPELVEIPIKTSLPEHVCKKCGKPRERILEKDQRIQQHWAPGTDKKTEQAKGKHGSTSTLVTGYKFSYKTVGWSDCGCNAEFEPGILLDPFAGSGTACLVAKQMGRRYIGIELNPEYVKMARKRLAKSASIYDWLDTTLFDK